MNSKYNMTPKELQALETQTHRHEQKINRNAMEQNRYSQ